MNMHPEAEEDKKKGNECMKEEKYVEAMFYYTRAIKMDPNNPQLHSNRSLAFLKMDQYYHALEDADKAVKLKPDWAKGYYRQGEVFYKTEHYDKAVRAYQKGMMLCTDDTKGLQEALEKGRQALRKFRKAQSWMPWKGIAAGVLVGLLIVTADEVLTEKASLSHIVLKILLIAAFTGIGYGIALGYRYFLQTQRETLLEAPIDLLGETPSPSSSSSSATDDQPQSSSAEAPAGERTHRKGQKATGRQRFRKGKS